MRQRYSIVVLATVLQAGTDPATRPMPDLLLGRFVDDYGIVHVISDTTWVLGQRDRYRIVFSHDSAQYLIARNDSANSSDPGKWSRIDWLPLDMPPYTWAFCLSEYKAETRAQAEASTTADREHPRTGCNGFPFSRMRRTARDSTERPY